MSEKLTGHSASENPGAADTSGASLECNMSVLEDGCNDGFDGYEIGMMWLKTGR